MIDFEATPSFHGTEPFVASARILDASENAAVAEAAEIIRRGGLVVFPTETVYGLGADACNPLAVARIFEAKRRPRIDPIIVHVADSQEASRYGDLSEERARILMERFWPGPLTLVVPKRDIVPPIVTAGLETVALRVPAHPVALALIQNAGRAIAAPSANIFGYVSPTEALHVADALSDKVDLILDGGRSPIGIESTVIALTGDRPCLLRAGGTPFEELQRIVGDLDRSTQTSDRPRAPGQLKRHYATRTPLEIAGGSPDDFFLNPDEKAGALIWRSLSRPERFAAIEVLSRSGDFREAAANLFGALRRLDNLGLDRIVAEPVPESGLGFAIMDRLRRCSTRPESD
jgi:L-threonylcarbamoyladenylate synthase